MKSEDPNHEDLFIRALDELDQKSASPDWYDNLAISRLLRQLLIDGNSLVNQANKEYKVKIRYHIGLPENTPSSFVLLSAMLDGFDPDPSRPEHQTALLSLDKFLAAKVMTYFNIEFAVHDLICFEANIKGGVHHGSPKDEKGKKLEELAKRFRYEPGTERLRGSGAQLRSISRVVLKALKPLREAIEAKRKTPPAIPNK